jgi:hypothetical protein
MENTAAREEWNVAYAIRDEELAEIKRRREPEHGHYNKQHQLKKWKGVWGD